jgi:hypothetical protein
MSHPSKQKSITYDEVVRILNTDDVQADLDDACEQLALSVVELTEKFDTVAKLLHTIDLQGPTTTFRAQWNVLRKVKTRVSDFLYLANTRQDFKDLVWDFRSNAGFISGRLKSESYVPKGSYSGSGTSVFCNVVLPLAARNSSGARSHDEKLQVLQSYMAVGRAYIPL